MVTRQFFFDACSLIKWKISLFVFLSGIGGFLVFEHGIDASLFQFGGGLFFLSAGAACLNNYQDRFRDRFMPRTRTRPLPAGRITPRRVLLQALTFIALGIIGLCFLKARWPLLLLGGFAVLCYNGLYTPFKFKTRLVVLPGLLCGAIPPLMGWMAAGGRLFVYPIWLIMAIMCIWQIPHVWLIQLQNGPNEKVCPQFMGKIQMPKSRLHHFIFVWVICLAFLLTQLPFIRDELALHIFLASLFNAILLVALFWIGLAPFNRNPKYNTLFQYLNFALIFGFVIILYR